MSASNDNAMARFLFAIIQQKNLKDIDWNAVARNPVLTQEITNGHAARMRYSRFRASLLGIEPQRRNRAGVSKSKATKSKKDAKTKKEKGKEEPHIKPDPNAAPAAQKENSNAMSLKVKNEAVVKRETRQTPMEDFPTPADCPPVSMAETQAQFQHNRLLTPCSDTDLFASSPGYGTSPTSEMLHTHEPGQYLYTAAAHCHLSPDQVSSSWQPSPSYSPFQLGYDMESYSATPSAFCDHQHTTTHPEGFGVAPSAMMPPDQIHDPVKHEEWDTRFC